MIDELKILKKIKEARKKRGFSQEEFAKELDLNKIAYNRIENGKTKLTVERLIQIVNLLGIDSVTEFQVFDDANSDRSVLESENERLNKRIKELEEQLDDKRRIIDFLSNNDLLLSVASKLYYNENPTAHHRKRDFNNVDSLLEEINQRPYDPGNKQSQLEYIFRRIEELSKNESKK